MRIITISFTIIWLFHGYCATGQEFRILCTHPVLKDWVAQIAGSECLVENVMDEHADPHTFEPSPKVLKKISEADVVVTSGTYLESWMAKVQDNNLVKGLLFSCVEQVKLEKAYFKHSGELDPHFWLDIENAIHFTRAFSDFFKRHTLLDPKKLVENGTAFEERLTQLKSLCRQRMANEMPEGISMASIYPGFQYFAKSMGWVEAYQDWIYLCEEEEDPTPRQWSEIRSLIGEKGINVILSDSHTSKALVNMFNEIKDVTLVPDLIIESLHGDNHQHLTYESMFMTNINTILSHLGKTSVAILSDSKA